MVTEHIARAGQNLTGKAGGRRKGEGMKTKLEETHGYENTSQNSTHS